MVVVVVLVRVMVVVVVLVRVMVVVVVLVRVMVVVVVLVMVMVVVVVLVRVMVVVVVLVRVMVVEVVLVRVMLVVVVLVRVIVVVLVLVRVMVVVVVLVRERSSFSSLNSLNSAMEKEEPWKVTFRNVAQTYFPQTRVECRYSLSREHRWSCHDWIGLFKVGWTSVRDYHTYVWAHAPEDYTPGKDVNCCILLQPSYLPNPGPAAYQFLYVDDQGEICAASPHFTFSAPKPLDELVTLEEERNGEEESDGDDLLLVVPRSQILQSHLEACQKELLLLQKKFRESCIELEKQQEKNEMEIKDFETERVEMRNEIKDLTERLRCSMEKIERMEEKKKDVLKSHENISAEFSSLLTERAENHQRIKDLEEDVNSLVQQKQHAEAEIERMKERVRKLTTQRKDEEDERKNLQMESKRCREELRVLQERLENSERSEDAFRRDLCELGALQSQNQAELHQIRLQAAQTTLQLSQANLNLREGQAAWAKERENIRKKAELDKERVQKLSHELQKKEEWLQEERTEREKLEQELGNEKACNRELRASVRAMQKEREQHQLEKQELLDHIRVFRLRMESDRDAVWNKMDSDSRILENSDDAALAVQKSDFNGEEDGETVNLLQTEEEKEESHSRDTVI
ncbi:transcription elongation factor B (SIII), polypeptide 3 isoform X1 [Silurus asotus]|uniref:Transcription elongation factor B (SIII), polypeptide 3 isoform X1 n=1 Tax=Silurus asotus TaxID=30991 RepID=A0AAD5AHE6_SILAS|nr:transcription elongation factor B (SIII), polypeptide 3 isoform X1 [Silurus asotus]